MRSAPTTVTVVIGMGNPMRRDDGVGVAVIEQLERMGRAGEAVELVRLDGESTRLIDRWAGERRVIVVDAGRAGGEAGEIHRVVVGRDALPAWAASASTHAAGLAEAIALAEVLDRLPEELVIYGVEPADMSMGEGLSPAVAGSLPEVVERIVAELER